MMEDLLVNESPGDARDLRDIERAREFATVLLQHYPGHIWHIAVDSSPSVRMVDIKLNYPDKFGLLPKYGYKIMLDNATPDRLMRAGGELLERYRLARGRASSYALLDAINNGYDRSGEIR